MILFKGENAPGKEIELTPEQKKRYIKVKYPNTSAFLLMDVIKNVSLIKEKRFW